ncbi:hypothetical protein LTT75_23505, partial [Escherichia coli]|nr:hypothetical protein [Escherichia coli]
QAITTRTSLCRGWIYFQRIKRTDKNYVPEKNSEKITPWRRPWNKLSDIRTLSAAFQRGWQKGLLARFVTVSADAQSRSEARSPLTKPA